MESIKEKPGARSGSTGKVWSAAVLLTVLMHTAVIGTLWILRPFTPSPVQAKPSDPIELVFVSDPEPASQEPTFFSELPEDRADIAPEDPDFLSNIDSRARDQVPGEKDGSLPRLEGSSDAPHVPLTPGDPAPSPPPVTDQTSPRPEPDLEDRGSEIARVQEIPPPTPDPKSLLIRPDGSMDFFQEAMDNSEGGVLLSGGVSLNTVAWEYAPWLQRFRRDFLRDWRAPYAYHMGLIDGWHVLELEILPSGELARLELKTREGSDALVETSSLTFETLAPFQPLPEDFPEESLVLVIKLVYPKVPQQPSRRPIQQNQRTPRRRGDP